MGTALRFGGQQVHAFESTERGRFVDEMVAHLLEFSPRRCGALPAASLHDAVESGIRRADAYALKRRGPIRSFLEAMVLLGSEFDTDPMHLGIASRLRGREDEMVRARFVYAELMRYRDEVTSPDGSNLREGLAALIEAARGAAVRADDPRSVPALAAAFPAKAAHAGEQGLRALARRAMLVAHEHGLAAPRTQGVLLVTMFALGHGALDDWSYPSISAGLVDRRDAEARAGRFEAAALAELMREHAAVGGEVLT